MIKLTHPFINICPDIDEFLKADNEHGVVCTINSFCYKIKNSLLNMLIELMKVNSKGMLWNCLQNI